MSDKTNVFKLLHGQDKDKTMSFAEIVTSLEPLAESLMAMRTAFISQGFTKPEANMFVRDYWQELNESKFWENKNDES